MKVEFLYYIKKILRPKLTIIISLGLLVLSSFLLIESKRRDYETYQPLELALDIPNLNFDSICERLQDRLYKLLPDNDTKWALTVTNNKGDVLADIKGNHPMVPASNMKLLTTAFALDTLGPEFRLFTTLALKPNGHFDLSGEGDPDLDLEDIQLIVNKIQSSTPIEKERLIPVINLYEESYTNWWPLDWLDSDKVRNYGAPITRLALTSNTDEKAIKNPLTRIRDILEGEISKRRMKVTIAVRRQESLAENDINSLILYIKKSAPMQSLLSLSNSESHNFTAEVLLKHSANSWDTYIAADTLKKWLELKNIDTQKLVIKDGSGLSRSNRLTSRSIAELLMKMSYHDYSSMFESSMAISGIRGTLRDFARGTELEGNFFGKTGSLYGVRTVSGGLRTQKGILFVSIMNQGDVTPDKVFIELLKSTRESINQCS
ncbi:D-alanyl-D-alanine carboxypeptidase [Prochlorococcus sp. MIT 1300]|uniref:D-alanyl-D-alanine carboxypeptidase n=1 Tax=Prochlorococcus sp. MIT 1300 TaxID=3096218 RepID=UPI002A74A7B8|nr:D-alanyl-D-alanine carboxypeptidase [Prochlorococcus sp. MIT 1300]